MKTGRLREGQREERQTDRERGEREGKTESEDIMFHKEVLAW